MPRVKICDGPRTIEIEDDEASLTQVFVLATDAMDHRAESGMWLPQAYREQKAAKRAAENISN